jgi:uncharacterized protein YdiU (UPF0061 family)
VTRAEEALAAFAPKFEAAFHAGLRRKVGLLSEREGDLALVQDLLDAMAATKADFTLTFRRLSDATPGAGDETPVGFADPRLDSWILRWRDRLKLEPQHQAMRQGVMRAANPAFIPRNHRVEAVIEAATEGEDFGPFEELLKVLAKPYEDQPAFAKYRDPPQPHEHVQQTFCGT